MRQSLRDKIAEKSRYDKRASLAETTANYNELTGSGSIPLPLREPYLKYEEVLKTVLSKSSTTLELCAGMGLHSEIPCTYSKLFIASDISESSLEILKERLKAPLNLETVACDFEFLPFRSESFDVVACAGGLSYGDNKVVMGEILRVLKPGGYFVCVDSLNHNPIYVANRYVHYLLGRRTVSTLTRMPRVGLIEDYAASFGELESWFFGGISWLIMPLSAIIGEQAAFLMSKSFDDLIKVKRLAFKGVLVAKK